MVVMPVWMLKYVLVIGCFACFFEQGSIAALLVGCASLAWCVNNWKNHEK